MLKRVRILSFFTLACMVFLSLLSDLLPAPDVRAEPFAMSPTMQTRVDALVRLPPPDMPPGMRIRVISGALLGTPYRGGTLIGGPNEAERLVVRLDGFDCVTFLEVVEAMRRSHRGDDFAGQLRAVRYRGGEVTYATRRHFFSDWIADDETLLRDVTTEIGREAVKSIDKQLNRKRDGSLWLDGLPAIGRTIHYLPTAAIDAGVLAKLQDGDYVGIYSEQPGLDVSHTGLIVRSDEAIMLRHASSRHGVEKVVDNELTTYLREQPGLIIYRAVK